MKLFDIFCLLLIVKRCSALTDRRGAKIVGGYDCKPEVFPYVVSIEFKYIYKHLCGGSLIKASWVLTAAHCGVTLPENLIVIAGLLSLTRSAIQESAVENYYVHPKFSLGPVINDICLIKVWTPFVETESIRFMSLSFKIFSNSFVDSCNNSLVMGYGCQTKLSISGEIMGVPNRGRQLKCANLSVLHDLKCYEIMGNRETHFCAVDATDDNQDPCRGDSGGPMICNGKQIGIVSSGLGCGLGLPSFYTRVYMFEEYIKYIMANNSHKISLNGSIISCIVFIMFKYIFFH